MASGPGPAATVLLEPEKLYPPLKLPGPPALAVLLLPPTLTTWLAHRTVNREGAKEETGSLSPFITTVALVYGVLLGFTVVVAWKQFSTAEINVSNEASTLATM